MKLKVLMKINVYNVKNAVMECFVYLNTDTFMGSKPIDTTVVYFQCSIAGIVMQVNEAE